MRREVIVAAMMLSVAACGRDSTPRLESAAATHSGDPAPSATASDPSGDSPASDATVQVSERGVGPLHVGMTLSQAREATGDKISAPPAADTASCGFARWSGGPPGLRLMTAKGRIVRVDVDSGSTTTAAGARIGDSEARINTLYAGRVVTTPSKYTEGHDLTVRRPAAADSAYRFIFETDGKRVRRYRAGRMPEVGYVEGCG
jgi:hypothetical protein